MFGLNALLSLGLATNDLQLAAAVDVELRARDDVTRTVAYVSRSTQLSALSGDDVKARRTLIRHLHLQPTCAQGWEHLTLHLLTNRCYAQAVGCCDVTALHDKRKTLKNIGRWRALALLADGSHSRRDVTRDALRAAERAVATRPGKRMPSL